MGQKKGAGMTKKRLNWIHFLLVVILSVCLLTITACSANVASTTSSSTATSTSLGSSTTTSSVSSNTEPEVLKIGYTLDLSLSTSLESLHAIEALVDKYNKDGGWDIGVKKYQIRIIDYDAGDQTKSTAAINRLISEDKVKFIMDMGNFINSDLPITEANKVLNLNTPIIAALALNPQYNYSFGSTGLDISVAGFWGWLAKNYDLSSKIVVGAFPESQLGHFMSTSTENGAKPFGIKVQSVFYPANSQDFSALATRVVTMNADFFVTVSGSDPTDANVYNAVRQAGSKAQFIATVSATAQSLSKNLIPDALNGFICRANATEFDPPLTDVAKEVKQAWTEKYGDWTYPDLSQLPAFFMLKAALEQAGSTDVDKVAALLSSGMKFNTIDGPTEMISRTDIGNDRTVDTAFTLYIKKISDGKPVLIDTINPDEAISNFRVAFPPLPPGATPPVPGGPGGPGGPGPGGPAGGPPPS